ncbi:hypothetical protein P3547_19900 [Vibrio parahaemolyticus]|nr:hypothetical protein [Vibrio parahaemolyticus]
MRPINNKVKKSLIGAAIAALAGVVGITLSPEQADIIAAAVTNLVG